jgi:replicative DNA helicase
MSGFNDTMELERSLLHLLVTQKMTLQKIHNKIKEDYFTSKERKFIRDNIVRTFKTSKGLLTQNIFDYEVRSRIDVKDAHFYEMEWSLINGLQGKDEPEVLLERLGKAHVGRQLLDVAESVAEFIEKGKIDEAQRFIKTSLSKISDQKQTPDIVELTDYKHRLEVIQDKKDHPEKYLGIKTGFATFDNATGGLFPGELTLFSAITGVGKSTILKQIETGIIKCNKNKNVLHICNEEHLLQVETKFDAQMSGIPYRDFKLATITDENLEKWKTIMEVDLRQPGIGRIFVKEVPAFTDITLIEEAIRELEAKGIKIDVVIIDHLPHVKPVEQAWGEFDEQGKAATDCKELGRAFHLAVVTATQASTEVEKKQTKGKAAGKMDVYGSKEQVHVANTSIAVTVTGKDDSDLSIPEWERDVYWSVDIKKNRDGACFAFKAVHHVKYGFVEERKEEPKQNKAVDNSLNNAVGEVGKGTEKGKQSKKQEEKTTEEKPKEESTKEVDQEEKPKEDSQQEEKQVEDDPKPQEEVKKEEEVEVGVDAGVPISFLDKQKALEKTGMKPIANSEIETSDEAMEEVKKLVITNQPVAISQPKVEKTLVSTIKKPKILGFNS